MYGGSISEDEEPEDEAAGTEPQHDAQIGVSPEQDQAIVSDEETEVGHLPEWNHTLA